MKTELMPDCFGKWKDCEIATYVNCPKQFLCYKADEEAADRRGDHYEN
jgi:hypothetical protein